MSNKTPEEVTIPEIVDETPLDLYNGNRVKVLLDQLKDEVGSLVLDPADPNDYKAFGSIQRKISSFKTTLDKKGDEIVRPIKTQIKEVDAQRKLVRDTCDRLRADFLKPREEYDAEIKRREQEVAAAFELFERGWQKVGEFREPTQKEWDDLVAKIEGYEIDPELFGERAADAEAARSTGLEVAKLKRQKFIDDAAALEAGKKALADQKAKDIADQQAAQAGSAAAAAPGTPKEEVDQSREHRAKVNREVMAAFEERGIPESVAMELTKQIALNKIPHLQIVY